MKFSTYIQFASNRTECFGDVTGSDLLTYG